MERKKEEFTFEQFQQYLLEYPLLANIGYTPTELFPILANYERLYQSGLQVEDLYQMLFQSADTNITDLKKLKLFRLLTQITEEKRVKETSGNQRGFQYRKSNHHSILEEGDEKKNAAYIHVFMLGLITFLFESLFLVVSYFLFRV